jgi:hypothetical protein
MIEKVQTSTLIVTLAFNVVTHAQIEVEIEYLIVSTFADKLTLHHFSDQPINTNA